MNKLVFVFVLAGVMAVPAHAASEPAEIKVRDVDFSGTMVVNSDLSLTVTFDVKENDAFDVKENDAFDELVFDFYLLLTPREKERGDQFLHCRTVHRYLEKESGYKSGIRLNRNIVKCMQPRDNKYAVVVSYQGKEVAMENSEKERWWEDGSLGQPVENILGRFASVPYVREWESKE